MAFKIVVPKLSEEMKEGRILQWMKQEGDRVEGGEAVASVETDKAEIELEAFGAGVLRKIVVPAGESAPVGSLIGVIAEPDEDISDLVDGGPAPAAAAAKGEPARKPEAPQRPEPAAAPAARPPAMERGAAPPPAPPAQEAPRAGREEGWVRASPVARRLAREAGIDIAQVPGTGPQGRILERDVQGFLEGRAKAPAAAPAPVRDVDFEERDPSAIRRTIASRMIQSKAPVPHFYLTSEVDMGQAAEFREALNASEAAGRKVSFTDILMKACALALPRHPLVNAAYVDGKIRLYHKVDVGIAVALEEGLITPVVRRCDQKSLRQISQEAAELAERARVRKLKPEEYTGATFTISNLGMFDIEEFSAIINPPEAAILAVGAIVQKPVVVDGAVTVRRRMRLTLSCDHRVADGATAARFLQDLKAILERPYLMVI